MKRKGQRWLLPAGGGLICFLGIFMLSLAVFFPTGMMQRWVNSLNIPGRISVASVDIDPLLRLSLRKVSWTPGRNPLIESAAFDRILLRPSWGRLLRGKAALSVKGLAESGHIAGTLQWMPGSVNLTLSTPRSFPLPLPFHLHKGITLKGSWSIKANLRFNRKPQRGALSGSFFLGIQQLRTHWSDSPLGPLSLSFISGTLEGSVDRSVFEIRKIDFRGNDLMIEGNVTIWMDPLSGEMRAKGLLSLQPRRGLARTNPHLDAAIRMLPHNRRGYQLNF